MNKSVNTNPFSSKISKTKEGKQEFSKVALCQKLLQSKNSLID
jgi:hypothetical protein